MLHSLRRHRQGLGRSLVGLLLLAWMTVVLQPCAAAEEPPAAPAVPAHHAMHGHALAAVPAEPADAPCVPGADCPVFKAVDAQAATKAAEPASSAVLPAPALVASWPVALPLPVRTPSDRHWTRVILPPPPILEFRVLLI